MKKKLFFLLAMVATFMCLLAVVSFAATPDTTRETFTLADGTVLPIWDTDGNGLIWYKSTEDTEDGYANYDYVSNNQTDSSVTPYISHSYWNDSVLNQTSEIVITTKSGATHKSHYSGATIVLANMKGAKHSNGKVFNCYNQTFRENTVLEVVFLDPSTTTFAGWTFYKCSSLRKINLAETAAVKLGGEANFAECPNLVEFALPSTVKEVHRWQFQNTGITEFTIPESVTYWGDTNFNNCQQLVNVYGYEEMIKRFIEASETGTYDIPGSTFKDCAKLNMPFTNGVIPEGVKKIGSYAFDDCNGSGWSTLVLPNTLTNLGQNAFQGCKGLKKVVLGASFTTWDSYDGFKNCSALEEVWIPETMTAIAGNVFNTAASNCVFYFTGTKDQLDNVKANANSNNSAFHNAYNQAKSWDEFQDIETKSGRYIVYDVNKCFAFYDNKHTLTGTDCTVDDACKICTLPIEAQAGHDKVEKLVYPNGFTQVGVYTCDCIFNGCTVIDIKAGDEGSEAAALFNGGEGFSTKGDDGIAGGYTIDVDAVEKYKEINGSLTMGIMVVNPNYYYGKDSFFDATGKVNTTGGAIQVELVDNQYKNVNVALTGFTGNAESVSLIIALYAYEDVENVEFIQSSTTACGDKNVTVGGKTLYTVTLASVKAGNSDLSNLGDYEIPKKDEE